MKKRILYVINRIIFFLIKDNVLKIIAEEPRFFVKKENVLISESAHVSNAFFNTNSGKIKIGDYTFFGQNVSLITGTHDYNLTGKERMYAIKEFGNDIIIGNGVWIGSNAVIIGPCVIGDNSVIAASSVVVNNVDKNCLVAGMPAKLIKMLKDE
jgi:acetyltransferase-like isoleucine patch superfamily enzyme